MKKSFSFSENLESYFSIEGLMNYESLTTRAAILSSNRIPWFFLGDNPDNTIIVPTKDLLHGLIYCMGDSYSGLRSVILNSDLRVIFVDESGKGYRDANPFSMIDYKAPINIVSPLNNTRKMAFRLKPIELVELIVEKVPPTKNKDGLIIIHGDNQYEFNLLDYDGNLAKSHRGNSNREICLPFWDDISDLEKIKLVYCINYLGTLFHLGSSGWKRFSERVENDYLNTLKNLPYGSCYYFLPILDEVMYNNVRNLQESKLIIDCDKVYEKV